MSTPEANQAPAGLEPDDWLDTLLRDARPAALADDGFSARVLRRVLELRVCGPAPLIAADHALARLRLLRQQAQRRARWRLGGVLVGCAVAAFATVAGGGFSALADPAPPTAWALVLASMVVMALVLRHERD